MIMASILELSRHRKQIYRELLRRIGYTNGLHDIYRFARLVEYLYPKIPSTNAMLQSIIIDQEAKVSGKKYAQGIIDVAWALLLINKVGQKLSLSDRGYALHSIEKQPMQEQEKNKNRRAFLLMSVLESDGEYFINLLDMVSKGESGNVGLGRSLIDRMFKVIDLKEHWANTSIHSSISRDIVKGNLLEAKRRLEKATDPNQKENQLSAEELVEMFFEHTVNPRLGWLDKLGCAKKDDNGHLVVTEQGKRLLIFFKTNECWRDGVYLLPLSYWLAKILDADNLADAKDLFWRAVATAMNGHAEPYIFEDHELLSFIKNIYPHIKLYGFNEAELSSIFHALSCMESVKGYYIQEEKFDDTIISLVQSFPKKIFQLSKRRGRGGYLALKKYIK